ncbi:MAG: type III-B CRISPR-associated protein Cas10/Cmr2 [Deltaproteobacteria bacterium]|nr:type III-B CRISPR-associated protein Cas10/Cmr2 [Deltaproteobacteria bacterium]
MNISRFRSEPDYWDQKLANYLHDPPDKALRIPGHEERSRELLEALGGLPSPDKNCYQRADQIAAGMDRTQLPGYSPDETKNGAVDFLRAPVLTHPVSRQDSIILKLGQVPSADDISEDIRRIVLEDIDGHSGRPGLSDRFQNDRAAFAPARFHYVHHVLRERLASHNVAGLGGVWHRIPADTRIPDHSIWQHCALVSALSSCFQLSDQKKASLLVFNITPVQDFIGRARKLRDFWTGSLILSWLAFEGIRYIVYTLGSDHILYPSLIGQPLVNWLLGEECGLTCLKEAESTRDSAGVASFPNKFVCLVPTGQEGKTAEAIGAAIRRAWLDLGQETLSHIETVVGRKDAYLKEQFDRQMASYWEFHWAACPLLDDASRDTVQVLLHKAIWQGPLDFIEASKELPHAAKGEGAFYGVTHALVQGHMAAGKIRRNDCRREEPGIKCNLHGDIESLRFSWKDGDDQNPRPANDPFWSAFKKAWHATSDFKTSERLSAVAMVKRLAYRVAAPDHPLGLFFRQSEGFPSSTEMALVDWLDRVEQGGLNRDLSRDWRKKLAQYLHETESERRESEESNEITEIGSGERTLCKRVVEAMSKAGDPVLDEDRYYAILLMDGDHMGRLVNGETLASTWRTALHPGLAERLGAVTFEERYRVFWEKMMNRQRVLAPAVHAAISEALGDFALWSVPLIIKKLGGQLIYAGGDDICAVLPASTALQAAREIAEAYSLGFIFLDDAGHATAVSGAWEPAPGRLALHLGQGEAISISAGILIAHHKKPLSAAMRRAHELLDQAKKKGGRNGLALELEKRAGGGRTFMAQWNEPPFEGLQLEQTGSPRGQGSLLDCFNAVGVATGSPGKRSMSVSLAYRLDQLRPGLEAIISHAPQELARFLAKQIERSRTDGDRAVQDSVAQQVAALIARKHYGTKALELDTNSLIIAKFIGTRQGKRPNTGQEASHDFGTAVDSH